VIYLDTSVALAHLLAEDRRPPDALWKQPLVTSRLLEYELWTRLHARRLGGSHGEAARRLVERLAVLELLPNVLARFDLPDCYRALQTKGLRIVEPWNAMAGKS